MPHDPTHDFAQTSSTRSLTALYIASLSAIAGLAIFGQILVQQQLARQSNDISIISAAQGRQTLCQRMLKASLAVKLIRDPTMQQQSLVELQAAVSQWEASRYIIHDKMQATVSATQLAELQPIFQRLKPASEEILASAKEILANPTPFANAGLGKRRVGEQVSDPQEKMVGPRLLLAEKVYTKGIDEIMTWHNQIIKNRVKNLQQLEFGLLGLTLVVLLLEGMLVFRPAVRKLQQTLLALAKSLQETQEKSVRLAAEQEKSERLLLNILPEAIADRLKQDSQAIADGFGEVTILFADVVGFTELASRLSPKELVSRLNDIFSRFDALAEKHKLEKIKTIGDAYMVVGGLPEPRADHVSAIADMAIDMQHAIRQLNQETGESFSMRMGINTGPVVAGVIGTKKFIYDLWGDTVNVASRMESHGMPGSIQVTEATYRQLQTGYQFEERGVIHIKGKGDMKTYWLQGKTKTPIGV